MSKKECPSCAMEIDRSAKICPVCNYEFPRAGIWFRIAILLLVALFLYMIIF